MYYTVTPLPDELLSSWLIRSSILNGTDPMGFAGGIWFDNRIWTKDLDRYISSKETYLLQKHTTLSLSQIYNLTLEPIYSKLRCQTTLNPKKHWDYIIPTGIRNRTKTNGLHFCTLCLKDPVPYLKKQWRLSWNTICEKHHILLHLKCSSCGHCFSPHLITYTDTDFTKCQYCHTSLIDNVTTSVNHAVLELQKFLNLSLKEQIISPNNYPLIDKNITDLFATIRGFMLFFRDLIHSSVYYSYRDTLFEEMSYRYVPIERENESIQVSIDALPVNQRYKLLEIIAHLFQFSLSDIIILLQESDISRQLFGRSIKLYSPTLIYIKKALIHRPKILCKHDSYLDKKYLPRSKEEVEILMDEIRAYL